MAKSAADRHTTTKVAAKENVKWKDVLENKWKGPDLVLIRSRGAVCVFPQDADQPLWVPERLTRRLQETTVTETDPRNLQLEEDGKAAIDNDHPNDSPDAASNNNQGGTSLGNPLSLSEADAP